MDEIEKDGVFSTRDLYLAATLVTLKFDMIGIDCMITGDKNMPIGFFKFPETPELQKTKSGYVQGTLLVEPKQYVTNLKSLKSEIVNLIHNPRGFK